MTKRGKGEEEGGGREEEGVLKQGWQQTAGSRSQPRKKKKEGEVFWGYGLFAAPTILLLGVLASCFVVV